MNQQTISLASVKDAQMLTRRNRPRGDEHNGSRITNLVGFMTSSRQRRTDILQHRAKKKLANDVAKVAEERARQLAGQVLVNPSNLKPTNSYSIPDYVTREFYVDKSFQCKDCGKSEVWTATQQKWWYEVAHGDVWTTATRCRACRKKESARKAAARKVHLDGIANTLHRPHCDFATLITSARTR